MFDPTKLTFEEIAALMPPYPGMTETARLDKTAYGGEKMTYDEALQALKSAHTTTWCGCGAITIHDELTQAIEVFKRMKEELDALRSDEGT